MTLSEVIRMELARQRISYAALARELGTTRQRVWQRYGAKEADSRSVAEKELLEVSQILGIPAWELLKRAEEKE